jgi:hypothetical protein
VQCRGYFPLHVPDDGNGDSEGVYAALTRAAVRGKKLTSIATVQEDCRVKLAASPHAAMQAKSCATRYINSQPQPLTSNAHIYVPTMPVRHVVRGEYYRHVHRMPKPGQEFSPRGCDGDILGGPSRCAALASHRATLAKALNPRYLHRLPTKTGEFQGE